MRMDTNQEMQLTQEDSGPAAYEFEIENDETPNDCVAAKDA